MALTTEVLFVNVDYLKHLTNLNGSVEDSYVVPAVVLAQDKYMQQYLGTDLLVKLKAEVSGDTLAGNYEVLMDTYVRKATAWWTMVELIPNLYVRLDNGGLMIRAASNTTPITHDDLHSEIERARQNAQFYTERLVTYLSKNSTLFSEYTSNQYPDIHPYRVTYNQNGFTVSHGMDDLAYRNLYRNVLDCYDCGS